MLMMKLIRNEKNMGAQNPNRSHQSTRNYRKLLLHNDWIQYIQLIFTQTYLIPSRTIDHSFDGGQSEGISHRRTSRGFHSLCFEKVPDTPPKDCEISSRSFEIIF